MSRPSLYPQHARSHSLAPLPHTSISASTLNAKIQEKRQELEDLQTLRALSDRMAKQMEELADKLETLTDGTAAVATVMANWGSVLKAVKLASEHIPRGEAAAEEQEEGTMKMPVPLVRIGINQPQE